MSRDEMPDSFLACPTEEPKGRMGPIGITEDVRRFIIESLGQGKYYDEIADDIISFFEQYSDETHKFLVHEIARFARSDDWKMYLEEQRQQSGLVILTPIADKRVRLERLEALYQKANKRELEKVIVDPESGKVHKIYRNNTKDCLAILDQVRREMVSIEASGKPNPDDDDDDILNISLVSGQDGVFGKHMEDDDADKV